MTAPDDEGPAGSAFAVSRAPRAGAMRSTVNLRWEERTIYYFQGYEFHPGDPSMSGGVYDMPACLERGAPANYGSMSRVVPVDLARPREGEWTYESSRQRVRYRIVESRAKNDFRRALATPGAIVFYAGHARYGRGPCFGQGAPPYGHRNIPSPEPYSDARDQSWGALGADIARSGIFAMGHRYVGVPIKDVLTYRYDTLVVSESDVRTAGEFAPADCDAKLLRPRMAHLQLVPLRDLDRFAQRYMQGARMHRYVPFSDEDTRVWTFDSGSAHYGQCLVVPAGYSDLAEVDLACRMYIMVACASFTHYHDIVRGALGWRRRGDDRLAFWLSDTGEIQAANYLLYHMLTDRELGANQSWNPWMRRSVRAANDWLLADGARYTIL